MNVARCSFPLLPSSSSPALPKLTKQTLSFSRRPGLGVREHEALLMEFFCTFGLLFGAFAIAFDPRGWGKLGPVAIAIIVAINVRSFLHFSAKL
jgi:glycerol uptake facilitator-like aquaporin